VDYIISAKNIKGNYHLYQNSALIWELLIHTTKISSHGKQRNSHSLTTSRETGTKSNRERVWSNEPLKGTRKIKAQATGARFWQMTCGGVCICVGGVLLKWGKPGLKAWDRRIKWQARGVDVMLKIKIRATGARFWRTMCSWAWICVGRVLIKWGKAGLKAWDHGIEQQVKGIGFLLKISTRATRARFLTGGG